MPKPSPLTRIANELTLIRLLLEQALSQAPEPEQTEPPICPHPVDQRLALGNTNGWQCQTCQFQQPPT